MNGPCVLRASSPSRVGALESSAVFGVGLSSGVGGAAPDLRAAVGSVTEPSADARARCSPAAVERRTGRLLRLLRGRDLFLALGFVRLSDYVVERLGVSYRSAQEWMRADEALERLPLAAAAFEAGEITSGHVRLLTRVGRPENEAYWVGLARRLGVRAFGSVLAAWEKAAASESREDGAAVPQHREVDSLAALAEEEPEMPRLEIAAPAWLAASWRESVAFIRQLTGAALPAGDLPCRYLEVDEIWTFVRKKQLRLKAHEKRNRSIGDQYAFVALDAESKLVPCFRVGKRDGTTALRFLHDLQRRLAGRIQLTTDGFSAYVDAAWDAWGADVDFAQLVKIHEAQNPGPGRYSPPRVSEVVSTRITGSPDPERVCTSYVERQNLTIRMACRRFTRLTNAFSKKLENLKAALALHFTYYNFVRVHRSLRVTPAMAAGVASRLWTLTDLLDAAS